MMFTTQTVSKMTGASEQQLYNWCKSSLIRPSGRQSKGRGSPRLYTFQDIVAIKTFVELRDKGCPLQRIRKAVRHLKAHYPDESNSAKLARLTLLTDGQNVYMLTDKNQVMEIVTQQHVWGLALGQLILEARQQVESLPMEWTEPIRVKGKTCHLRLTRDVEDGGFIVQCRELPGALSQGDTVEEAIANGKDAVKTAMTFLEKRERQAQGTKRAKAG